MKTVDELLNEMVSRTGVTPIQWAQKIGILGPATNLIWAVLFAAGGGGARGVPRAVATSADDRVGRRRGFYPHGRERRCLAHASDVGGRR